MLCHLFLSLSGDQDMDGLAEMYHAMYQPLALWGLAVFILG
jgi:hypothetical protein